MKTSTSDNALGDAVRSELEWDPKVDQTHIGVAAADGAVTLTGYVRSYAQEHAAVRAAERIYGVRAVASLFDLVPVSRDNDRTMLLAREIDTAAAFVHRTSLDSSC
jgi:osmotically-inducible protein OsmY